MFCCSAVIRLTMASLISQRLSASSLFCDRFEGSQKKQLLKYCPLIPVNSGAVAQ